MKNEMNKREYWNIIKGIGIISIILGHSCYFLCKWVYAYHMALFFFVAGFLFSDEKYAKKPFLYLGKRIEQLLPTFVLYESILFIMNNVFVDVGIYQEMPQFDIGQTLVNVLDTFFFQYSFIGGAAWFIKLLLVANVLFACIVHIIGNSLSVKSILFFVLTSFFWGGIGCWCCLKGYKLTCNGELALLMQPIMCIGWLIKKKDAKCSLRIESVFTTGAILILVWLIGIKNGFIDISARMIIGPIQFYLVSFSGIWICLQMGKFISKVKYIKNVFSIIGCNSYEIMILHIAAIKIVDLFYGMVIKHGDPQGIGHIPYGYRELWLAYLLAGIVFPILIARIVLLLKQQFNTLVFMVRSKN